MHFNLTIELGNDAMQTNNDVAGALHTLASYLRGPDDWTDLDGGTVIDDNGNTVGSWKLSESNLSEAANEAVHVWRGGPDKHDYDEFESAMGDLERALR